MGPSYLCESDDSLDSINLLGSDTTKFSFIISFLFNLECPTYQTYLLNKNKEQSVTKLLVALAAVIHND